MEIHATSYQNVSSESRWTRRMVRELWSKENARPKNHTDLEFKCIDGKVMAHKAFLQEFCSTVRLAINSIEFMIDPKVTIILPDFTVATVKAFLHLLYTGAVSITNQEEIENVKALCFEHLGFSNSLDFLNAKLQDILMEEENSDSEYGPNSKKAKIELGSNLDHDISKLRQFPLPVIKRSFVSPIKSFKKDPPYGPTYREPPKFHKAPQNENMHIIQKGNLPKGISESFLMKIKKEMCKAIVGPTGPLGDEERLQFIEPVCVVGPEEEEEDHVIRSTFPNVVSEDKYIIPKMEIKYGFKYILDSPTSSLVKNKDDRMTYINMGKFYELILGYTEDPSETEIPQLGTVRSVIMVVFRGKISEEEELKAWQYWHSKQTSSGFSFQNKNIIEADTIHCSGVIGRIEQIALNAIEIHWAPQKAFAKLNVAIQCLSTDFSDQKGVRGQPLHLQIDTFLNPFDPDEGKVVHHRGYSQIKIFRDKGAERKLRDEAKQVERLSQKLACKRFPSHAFQPSTEQTEFYAMQDTEQEPFLYKPSTFTSSPTGQPKEPFGIYNLSADETSNDATSILLPEETPAAKKPRTEERVMIYVKQSSEETYSALHVSPPSVDGLKDSIKAKFNIDLDLRNVFRRSQQGAIVKFDDEMIKFYSHTNTFDLEITKISDDVTGPYDLTLAEV